jgi:tetratricopeptide (TPR) repeat protein
MIRAGKVLLLLTICCCTYVAVAQDGKGDKKSSLKLYKSRAPEKSEELLKEAEVLKADNTTEALNRVQEALATSIAKKDVFNEAKCYLLIAEINSDLQEWKLALINFNNAYQIFSVKYRGTEEYRKTLYGISLSHRELGNLELALDFAAMALKSAASDDEHNKVQLHLSEIYYRQKDYPASLRTLNAIRTSKIKNPGLDFSIESQRAKIYAQMKDFERSQRSYSNSLNTARGIESQSPGNTAVQSQSNKEEIADVLRKEERYDDEILLRNQSIEYNLESDNLSEVSKDKVELSKAFEAKGEPLEALREVEEAAAIAENLNDPAEQANAFKTLAELYDKRGRSNDAIRAYRRYTDAVVKKDARNDSLLAVRDVILKKQSDIETVAKQFNIATREEDIEEGTMFRQQLVIYGLLLIILIIIVTSWFIYKGAVASKTANQLLALKSLRSQMNPHFIFNALNSVNHFIARQDERTANKFLSEFSLLMRLVLENSQEDFIPLQKEQEILSLYLKLEHYRFRDKFEYSIDVDPDINVEALSVPPMLIQPYIENAVWHGLRYKESPGHLNLSFRKDGSNVVVEISDDGIGREKSAALKTDNQKKHNSTGLKNIRERLAILNKVYKANYRVAIDDLSNGAGTRVRIFLPANV